MTTVKIEDCRAIKFCTLGVRRFFTKHGLDFEAFVKEGLDETVFPQDDGQVARVIDAAKKRERGN